MREADFAAFSTMLDAVCSLLSRGAYVPSSTNTALYFRALARYDLAQVRAGFDAHVSDPQRGRWVPVPADVIAQIDGLAADDGRPGPEEAWAIALRSADEWATVVWTEEMALAWGVARIVLDGGDEVGARMAFREAYSRNVDAARAERRPVRWEACLGFDQAGRAAAVKEAIALGRLPAPDVPLLEGPTASLADLAENPDAPAVAREALLQLRARIVARQVETSVDAAAKQETARLKADMSARVAEHLTEER